MCGRSILRNGVDAPNLAHHRKLVAIEVARELSADELPRIAAIVAAEEFIGGEIESRARVWTDNEWRVPVPTIRTFAAARLRLNADAFAGAFIETNQAAVLKFSVDDVRVFGIDLRAKAIAAVCHEPVGVDDAGRAASARWTTKAEVVLRAAINVVERFGVVSCDVVKLRDREVLFEVPSCTAIPALINPTIGTNQIVIGVLGIDPDVVIVDVLVSLAETTNRAAAVVRHHRKHIHDVDSIDVLGIRNDARVVHRCRVKLVATFPTATAIG